VDAIRIPLEYASLRRGIAPAAALEDLGVVFRLRHRACSHVESWTGNGGGFFPGWQDGGMTG
jgi:hypothetical protein